MKKQPNDAAELTIILLNYNGWEWVEKCGASLEAAGIDRDARITTVLVDNGSTDASLAAIRGRFPWMIVHALPENVGFAAGNNAALRKVTTPYALLLNTDAEVAADADVVGFARRVFADEHVAIATPKIVLDNGALDHACHRGFPTPWNAFTYFSKLSRLFPRVPLLSGYERSWQDLQSAHDIEACSGAAMFVRMNAAREVGWMDEDYFMYGEDIDWCYRFVQAGWRVWYDPSEVVVHHKHKSGLRQKSWETRERTIRAFYDTMMLFWHKHYADRYPRLVMRMVFAMIGFMKAQKLRQERKRL